MKFRSWGDEAHAAWKAGDRAGLDRLVEEAVASGDEAAILITQAWRGDLGKVEGVAA